MKDTTACRHCGRNAARTWHAGPYGVEEEYIDCACGYSYGFAYGCYTESVPGQLPEAWTYACSERVPVAEREDAAEMDTDWELLI